MPTRSEEEYETGVRTDPSFDTLHSSESAFTPYESPGDGSDELDDIMSESEEDLLLRERRENRQKAQEKSSPHQQRPPKKDSVTSGEARIEESRKAYSKLRGIKSARYITADIIRSLDEDFFDKYETPVIEASDKILNRIVDDENNDIAEAQDNPTDDDLQDKAYNTLYAATYEYLQSNHKDLNRSVMIGLIVNEILGFSVIDPLWRDRKIDEILCNGPHDIQIEVEGQLHKVPASKFRDKAHMYSLLEKLFGSINKTVSQMSPIVDGRLHDNSRMSAVHHVAAPDGPNFSIRRHPEEYFSPDHLLGHGSIDQKMLQDLGNWVNKGCSILITGGTGTGKTTTLNAISGFFPEDERLITMEDNIELMLHPDKLLAAPMEVVPPKPDRPDDAGVSMRSLLKASLRLRPDGIVLGEVRDAAAYDLIQALNTGHWGVSTVHANTASDAMGRLASLSSQSGLTTPEAELSMIASAFDLVVMIKRYPADGSRKIVSIEEVGHKPELGKDNEPFLPTHPLWKFIEEENNDPKDMTVRGHWEKLRDMSDIRKERKSLTLSRDKSWDELRELYTSHEDDTA